MKFPDGTSAPSSRRPRARAPEHLAGASSLGAVPLAASPVLVRAGWGALRKAVHRPGARASRRPASIICPRPWSTPGSSAVLAKIISYFKTIRRSQLPRPAAQERHACQHQRSRQPSLPQGCRGGRRSSATWATPRWRTGMGRRWPAWSRSPMDRRAPCFGDNAQGQSQLAPG
jgi:hypothetical protein